MIHIALCDDEPSMLEELSDKINAYFKHHGISVNLYKFPAADALLKCGSCFDIVFLDIRMGGTDGMEAAARLRERGYQGFLIFVTVLDELVYDAFEVQAFDYLVKPLENSRFEHTMGRLLSTLKTDSGRLLLLQKGCESRIIPFDDIVYCEVINRKVYLHLVHQEVVDYYDRLELLENKLDSRFYKCHRSYLVNLKYLTACRGGAAELKHTQEKIPVSRLRSQEFSAAIVSYIQNGGIEHE